jgi:hypothetical protein
MRSRESLSLAEVEAFLARQPQALAEIALELRNLVAAECPSAAERILWRSLSYHDPEKGGPVKGAICQISLARDHVRLSFIHGVRLADPDRLLRGSRLSKRFVRIDDYQRAPWEAMRRLIRQAGRLDPDRFEPLSAKPTRRHA